MKPSMTFVQSNVCKELDSTLKQIWRPLIWRQVSFKRTSKPFNEAISYDEKNINQFARQSRQKILKEKKTKSIILQLIYKWKYSMIESVDG